MSKQNFRRPQKSKGKTWGKKDSYDDREPRIKFNQTKRKPKHPKQVDLKAE